MMKESDTMCNISTKAFQDGTIRQVVDIAGQVNEYIAKTQDEQIKQALVTLGWTPPADNKPTVKAWIPHILDTKIRTLNIRIRNMGPDDIGQADFIEMNVATH
jgi:hypothetical protein